MVQDGPLWGSKNPQTLQQQNQQQQLPQQLQLELDEMFLFSKQLPITQQLN